MVPVSMKAPPISPTIMSSSERLTKYGPSGDDRPTFWAMPIENLGGIVRGDSQPPSAFAAGTSPANDTSAHAHAHATRPQGFATRATRPRCRHWTNASGARAGPHRHGQRHRGSVVTSGRRGQT